ncbi:MAG TPA: YqaE/Pmp3 family membrane protein [Bacteroidia bacterium]|jgi:uncharacterized membrane protein YqaE (UPF0057 family)|nr:YqaE/Pmp3 family membrane protein [Bacteroidia bacterium]
MKKLLATSILLIAGTALFSTNSNAQGITITKRHYNHGFYVDFGSKKKTETKASIVQTEKQNITSAESNTINTISLGNNDVSEQMTLVPVSNVCVIKERTNKHIATRNHIAAKLSNVQLSNNNDKVAIMPLSASDDFNASVSSSNSSNDSGISMLLLVIITILIPFLGVGLAKGVHGEFWLDLLLTLLFYVPGLIYGLIVVLS